MSEMLIQYLDTYRPEWPRLGYAKLGDAGMDLRAAIDREMVIQPGRTLAVPTGIKVALPHQYELQIRPRSGLAAKRAVTVINAPGTVDAGFRGEVQVLLVNHGHEPFRIVPGDRIAQGVIGYLPRLDLVAVEALPASERGEGGFGSTGVAA